MSMVTSTLGSSKTAITTEEVLKLMPMVASTLGSTKAANATVRVHTPLSMVISTLGSSEMTTTTVKVRLPLPMGGDLLVSGKTTNPTEEELKLMQMAVLLRRASLRTVSSFAQRKTNNRQSIDNSHEMQKILSGKYNEDDEDKYTTRNLIGRRSLSSFGL